jgi:hypothetical protein
MYTNKLMIAVVMTVGIHTISSAEVPSWCDEARAMREKSRRHWADILATDAHNAQQERAWFQRAMQRKFRGQVHIQNEVVTENGQQYLKITVHGIAKPEEAPKTMVREDNKISITTSDGSVSIEQKNGTITLNAHCRTETKGLQTECSTSQSWSDEQLSTIKFNEVTDFSITSQGDKAAVTVLLPLASHQSVTKTYSFESAAATDATPSEK